MKIAILSSDSRLYSTRRLKEACLARGHKFRVFHPLEFSIVIEQGKPALYYKDKPIGRYDAVIPRIGASVTFLGTSVVRQFEEMGVTCLNSSLGIITSRDKLRALQLLAKHHIGIPASAFCMKRSSIAPAIQAVGGCPVVIKLLEGTKGLGVMLAETQKAAEGIIETFLLTGQNVLIQEFIEESRGCDIRAIVVGNKVVAAMRRTARDGEFRSNVYWGSSLQAITLTPEFEQAAVRSSQILGLHVSGVDLIESRSGVKVLEVNSSPGLEGIEQVTGIDVAGAIVGYLEKQSASFQHPPKQPAKRFKLEQLVPTV